MRTLQNWLIALLILVISSAIIGCDIQDETPPPTQTPKAKSMPTEQPTVVPTTIPKATLKTTEQPTVVPTMRLSTPTPTPTPSPTYTTTPTGVSSDVQITKIFYDGQVYRVESDEYVEISNFGNNPQGLGGWVLIDIDEGYPSFTFPHYTLSPGSSIRVYTNEIHSEWGGFSYGYGKAIWNNSDPDTAALYDAGGRLVSMKSY
ncbi:MAG: lamin tail domain-containing protein [Chloroflexota bacterium]|nr:lamin tail domain-containing protein [Chloroflexota bacterium]